MPLVIDLMPLGSVVKPTRPRVKPADHPALRFIGMEHIEAHTMKLLGTVAAATMKSSGVHFKPGDVLYGRLRPYLNKVYRPAFEGLCSAEFIVLPETERLDGKYLQYFLNSGAFVRFASHLNAGDRPRVDFDQIAAHEIPLPGVDVQRRIVAEIEKQFSRLDEAVANLRRVKANLKRYSDAVLSDAVAGHPVLEARNSEAPGRLSAESLLWQVEARRREAWTGRAQYKTGTAPALTARRHLPPNWTLASLDALSTKITSGSRDWARFYGKGSSIFVLAQNVRPMMPDFSTTQVVDPPANDPARARSRLQRGDLMVTIVGANTGQACLVEALPSEAFVCQSVALVRPAMLEMAPYLNLWLNSPEHGQRYFAACMYGQGRPHLGFEQLAEAPIPVPPLAEQHRIVAEVDRRLSIVREVEAEVDTNLNRAQALRQVVLQTAFARKPLA
jgi:type I restriction enzyme S subunit